MEHFPPVMAANEHTTRMNPLDEQRGFSVSKTTKRDGAFSPETEFELKRRKQETPVAGEEKVGEGIKGSEAAAADFPLQETSSPSLPPVVTMSRLDKASTIQLSDCLKVVRSTKGYRTARATHGVKEGCWYFEVKIEDLGDTGHCRLGWATRQAHLYAPVGFDKYGYSYRDIEGTKQHRAERQPYGAPFTTGDVIGCLIYLPKKGTNEQADPEILPGNHPEKAVAESFIGFFRNGSYQGVAFQELLEGVYYPAVSMFTRPQQQSGVKLALNFGNSYALRPKTPFVQSSPYADVTSEENKAIAIM